MNNLKILQILEFSLILYIEKISDINVQIKLIKNALIIQYNANIRLIDFANFEIIVD